MGLRFALMGLVASLGLQPPPKADWERWVNSGRQICHVVWEECVDCANDAIPDARDAFAETDAPKTATATETATVERENAGDRAFETGLNDWVETVLLERPMLGERLGERLAKSGKIEVIEDVEFAETYGEALAEILNRQPEPAFLAVDPPAAAPIEVAAVEETVEKEDVATRLNRFGETSFADPAPIVLPPATVAVEKPALLAKQAALALRLTNDAASAWMSLFKESLVVSLRP